MLIFLDSPDGFLSHILDSTIDYLAQYRLVDRSRLEMYGRAFTLEDEDEDGIISYEVCSNNYVYIKKIERPRGFHLRRCFEKN